MNILAPCNISDSFKFVTGKVFSVLVKMSSNLALMYWGVSNGNKCVMVWFRTAKMDVVTPHISSAAKLRPSPAVPGSMEAAIKMWLQVGNVNKLQQVNTP